jgi:hypothetical protein
VAMMMLPIEWSARLCEIFPCHVKWMDVFETIIVNTSLARREC